MKTDSKTSETPKEINSINPKRIKGMPISRINNIR